MWAFWLACLPGMSLLLPCLLTARFIGRADSPLQPSKAAFIRAEKNRLRTWADANR